MLSTLPAAPTLGTMSIPDGSRPLELVEVPPGPAAIEALWGPLDAALAHGAAIAPIPRAQEFKRARANAVPAPSNGVVEQRPRPVRVRLHAQVGSQGGHRLYHPVA